MNRRKLTKKEMAAKVAKMKATKAAKKEAALKALGVPISRTPSKKIRKKRVLSEAQKQVLRDRINKAREAKQSAVNASIHESIRHLPDDHFISPKKVKLWIKSSKERLSGMRLWANSNDSKQRAAFIQEETYLSNLQSYLRDGIYKDLFFGEHMQSKVKYRVPLNGMAYYSDGTPKRSVGFYYEDIGETYTQEMYDEDNPTSQRPLSNKSKVYKTRRIRRKRA